MLNEMKNCIILMELYFIFIYFYMKYKIFYKLLIFYYIFMQNKKLLKEIHKKDCIILF